MASSSLAVLCISLVVLSAGLVTLAEDFKEDEYDIKHYVKSGVARDEYKTSVTSQHHIYEDDNIGSMSGEEEESVKASGIYNFCKRFCGKGFFLWKACKSCPASAPAPAPSSNHH
ncbi:hypothetical protein SELMODRAFT_426361 [Selaginella moellendorffii]|uniref:Uncharacterized protein n=1 Tax=Selaginella moellendorffii TaxID=88036 RepID=D8SW49_SELML|nr:hypothetical protein SELMODRAFT_426361 [Selaginella moellendorffii]